MRDRMSGRDAALLPVPETRPYHPDQHGHAAEGRRFFAFEGSGDDSGCCPMSCTHAWNYEQALAFLFPSLERSMRQTHFTANMKPDGAMAFRTLVPTGRAQWQFEPAADGQMGCLVKLYREWQMSGDEAFFVYADEVWTGIEYQVAAHLIFEDQVAEGLAIVKGIRDRYDGRQRNPWNEVECGSHYARALASWSVLLALTGYWYSAPDRRLTFRPRVNRRNFRGFFTAGTAWGVFTQRASPRTLAARLEPQWGELSIRRLELANDLAWPKATVSLAGAGDGLQAVLEPGDADRFRGDLGRDLVVRSGEALSVTISPR
jgi:hypothetical protein